MKSTRIHILLTMSLLYVTQTMAGGQDPLAEESSLEDELLGVDAIYDQIEVYGDVRFRGDVVRDLPRGVEPDFERATARARVGIIWEANDFLEFGLAGKVNWSTESNNQVRFNLDNERADDISLDELYVRFNIDENSSLLLGQSEFPLVLSPVIWDQDLRPQGLSFQHRRDIGDFNSFELTGGVFLGNHLFGDNSRIKAIQAAFRLGEGTPVGYQLIASYLDFSNLEELGSNGLLRSNSRVGGRAPMDANGVFANEYDIVDIQLGTNIRWKNVPIRLRVDLLKNVAVSDNGYAGRVDLILGNSIDQKGFELGVAAQRVQQDAVVAAFNDDDWWFATNMRGVAGWLGYGFTESMRARMSVFHERIDVVSTNNNRALFDLNYSF